MVVDVIQLGVFINLSKVGTRGRSFTCPRGSRLGVDHNGIKVDQLVDDEWCQAQEGRRCVTTWVGNQILVSRVTEVGQTVVGDFEVGGGGRGLVVPLFIGGPVF